MRFGLAARLRRSHRAQPAGWLAALAICLASCIATMGDDATEQLADAVPRAKLSSTATPPVAPLARQSDAPPSAPLPPSLASNRAELPAWFNEPLGTRIDFNPFANMESPSRLYGAALSEGATVSDAELQTMILMAAVAPPRKVQPTVKLAIRPADNASAVRGLAYPVMQATFVEDEQASDEPERIFEQIVLASMTPPAPTFDEQSLADMPLQLEGGIFLDHGVFRVANNQPAPLAPLQPLQPVQPPSIAPTQPSIPSAFDTLGSASLAQLAQAAGGAPVQGVGQGQAQALASTDLGGLLQSASSVQSVNATRRSPVALDPNVRGYKFGQIYSQATGAYWFPVRQDLDSMLSKIDPGMIQEVVVIPGPYGLQYGPGFSFIDIITQDTPRYDCGPGSDYRANGSVRTNGGQLYGRLTAEGGNVDYGYRVSYGHRKGSDYDAGNGLAIPSSYDTGDAWAQFGFNTNPHQRIEFSYLRLDQIDTEYAAQFFDVDALATDGTTLKLVDDDPNAPWDNFKLEGWWNRTTFNGSITPSKRRRDFPVIQRVEFSLDQEIGGMNTVNGNTLGSNVSSGARAVMLKGDLEDVYLRLGADFHYLEQGIRENYNVTNSIPPLSIGNFFTNLPFSRLRDEGLFAEYGFPLLDGWDIALGGRADWVDTTALRRDIRPDTNLDVNEIDQHDALYSYYLTNAFTLSDEWTLNLGMGYAQRPPTLTERYADGVFLGLLQSGFTRVIGDPTLRPERDFQVDAGLTLNSEDARGSLTYFYGWVIDYATFEGLTVIEFFDAKLVRYRNTPLATLTGFEAAGEFDWTGALTPFAKMKYVEGTDQWLGAPLFAIPPLEGTAGIRWHNCGEKRTWEIEAGTRIVNQQNRLGAILLAGVPTVIEERTGGFTTSYLRGFWNYSEDLTLVAGIDNLFNRSYQEHLDLRLLGPTGFPAQPTRVLSPGFTPYFGIDWTFRAECNLFDSKQLPS